MDADPSTLHVIALRDDHLAQALALSSALGWPYRDADWRFAHALGSGVAIEAEGRLVGTALWWPYGETHASFGMIIVAKEMQGRGLGRRLMDALLDSAGDRTVILNSTQDGLRLYTQLGFVPSGRVCQHQAVMQRDHVGTTAAEGVRPMQAADERSVRRLDRAATGMDRTALLDALFGAGTVCVFDSGTGTGTGVQGYACVREFGRGVVIGPVIAVDSAAAMALIATLAASHRGRFVRIDVSEDSGLSPWLIGIGLPLVDHAVSMVRGERPCMGSDAHLFALSNQSLG